MKFHPPFHLRYQFHRLSASKQTESPNIFLSIPSRSWDKWGSNLEKYPKLFLLKKKNTINGSRQFNSIQLFYMEIFVFAVQVSDFQGFAGSKRIRNWMKLVMNCRGWCLLRRFSMAFKRLRRGAVSR